MTCRYVAAGWKKSAVRYRKIIVGRLLKNAGLEKSSLHLHLHLHGRKLPYTVITVDAWVEDFIAALDAARTTP